MPTPFYHLALAEEILEDASLPASVQQLLRSEVPAFLLGNTAPDVQTLSGQPREATHFFEVPMRDRRPARDRMFAAWPELSYASELAPNRRAFLAGYLCHLLLDQLWIGNLFEPVFGPDATWGTFPERLYLHNVLRVYLDRQLVPNLPEGIAGWLRHAQPMAWLPFVTDGHLHAWRDFLAGQLEPGASNKTVEVFAARMGRDPSDFDALLASPADLERRLFSRVSRDDLARFRAEGLAGSLRMIADYVSEAVAAWPKLPKSLETSEV